jgi:hypothetical protein
MIRLVFVKLPNGKTEEFDATQLSLEAGEDVIVETEKGLVLGKVLAPPHEKEKRFFLKSLDFVVVVWHCESSDGEWLLGLKLDVVAAEVKGRLVAADQVGRAGTSTVRVSRFIS